MTLTQTPKVDLGWQAHPFTLPDFAGKSTSLAASKGQNGTVIAFICNHCPYVKKVIGQLVADAKALAKHDIATFAIMSNDWERYPDDSPTNMEQFAQAHGLTFPYLVDETQQIAKAYDAVCTPDFFGFDKNLQLGYRGRILDPQLGTQRTEDSDLRRAMLVIAKTGTYQEKQYPSVGCSIKWRAQ